jgi:hypothetical protein
MAIFNFLQLWDATYLAYALLINFKELASMLEYARATGQTAKEVHTDDI